MPGSHQSFSTGSSRLSACRVCVSSAPVNENQNRWLPVALMIAFAATRWPGLMPQNFSAAYALVFCAGVYLPRRLWWLPIATMAITDVALNLYYRHTFGIDSFKPTLLANYAAYGLALLLGRSFRPESGLRRLLLGGIVSAFLFYLITNTAAWFFNPFGNPEYTRDFVGWLIALTKGTAGHMATWEFFRNTLLSGGLFTALFVAAMKISINAESPLDKELPAPEEQPTEEPQEANV